jgi:hypothetical protein
LDLPWRNFTVRLRIWARRFFCDEPSCPRKIFAERFTGLLRRYGRRTEEATGLLLAFAQRAGGEAGAHYGEFVQWERRKANGQFGAKRTVVWVMPNGLEHRLRVEATSVIDVERVS